MNMLAMAPTTDWFRHGRWRYWLLSCSLLAFLPAGIASEPPPRKYTNADC